MPDTEKAGDLWVVSPIVPPRDADLLNRDKRVARLPAKWWARLAELGSEADNVSEAKADRSYAAACLIRWSMEHKTPAPIAEGPDYKDENMPQSSLSLAEFRWDLIDAEAKARNLSRNKVILGHLKRAFDSEDAEAASKKRSKK